jgi:hypothetical protein
MATKAVVKLFELNMRLKSTRDVFILIFTIVKDYDY